MTDRHPTKEAGLGAAYYWLRALWWLLLVVNFPFAMVERAAGVADDFTFAPAYWAANKLYDMRKRAGKGRRL